jgi:GH15 family glucan-1,4-alpha-glucosidase
MAVLAAGGAFSGGTAVDPPAPHGLPGVVPAFMGRTTSAPDDTVQPAGREGRLAALRRDRQWLARSRPLGDAAPGWARRMYRRSLLVVRASVNPDSGAAVAGGRAGWAYVWPRDAGAVAISLASAGYRQEARRVVRFLLDLDLGAAARFDQDGEPVEGRPAQGDAAGWVEAAVQAVGIRAGRESEGEAWLRRIDWRGHADYQEKDGGDYLGNAIASGTDSLRIGRVFGTPRGLVRTAGDPDSGLDSAAAWAVRPFSTPVLYPATRRTLLRLVAERKSGFGLVPSESWDGGEDPWTAPTAWSAWALAALAGEERALRPTAARHDRHVALSLVADLRRAATPLGLLPERVDAGTGIPASTTPLAWSHAFAILAIRELWP